MIFETHAHYDDEQFEEDREVLLTGMSKAGVGTIVNVGATLEGCRSTVALAEKYPFVYAAIGVHPDEVGSLNEETFAWLKERLAHERVVAVGEIGLDYYWDREPRGIQKKWFIRQLEAARERNLPVIIHSREAAADTMEIMKEYAAGMKAIIHCYSYSAEQAREYVKMGYLLGIGGVVTFKNARKLKEIVEETPLEALVLETDCPYLAPVPNRGKRNTSANLSYVAQEIADLKHISYEEVVRVTEENARKFFRVP